MKVFFSFSFDKKNKTENINSYTSSGELVLTQEQFVHRIAYYLQKQKDMEICCWNEEPGESNWDEIIASQLSTCDKMVYFKGDIDGNIQKIEREIWTSNKAKYPSNTIVVNLIQTDTSDSDDDIVLRNSSIKIAANDFTDSYAMECTNKIFAQICDPKTMKWTACDHLPIGYPFAYEKEIIEDYVKGQGKLLTSKRLQQGCPITWPQIDKLDEIIQLQRDARPNPIKEAEIGRYREDDEKIVVDVRTKYHNCTPETKSCLVSGDQSLTLLEAGPRRYLVHPTDGNRLNVGIVVSGGIAPGINAVIAGICQRHEKYHTRHEEEYGNSELYRLQINLYRDGFGGMIRGESRDTIRIDSISEANIADVTKLSNDGGANIGTSRQDELLDSNDNEDRMRKIDEIINRLAGDGINIFYVIGGDGSMRAAHAIWERILQRVKSDKIRPISVVAIPKTMDNDVLWVWQTFGFLSAVEKAKEFIGDLNVESKSNPRLCIMQLFGSDSGFVVSHAALASGVCKEALIPEVDFDLKSLSENIREKLQKDLDGCTKTHQSPNGIILLSETAIPRDVEDYIDSEKYPNLHLSTKEKNEIRRFIGSPLLTVQDVTDWTEFCSEILAVINCNDNGSGLEKKESSERESKRFKDEFCQLGGLVNSLSFNNTAGSQETNIQGTIKELIIDSINNLIIQNDSENICTIQTDRDRKNSSHIKKIAQIENIIKSVASLVEDNQDLVLAQFYAEDIKVQNTETLSDSRQDLFDNLKSIIDKSNIPDLTSDRRKKLVLVLNQLKMNPLSSKAMGALGAMEDILTLEGYLDRGKEVWFEYLKRHAKILCSELLKLRNRIYFELALKYIKPFSASGARRVYGQTPDALRSGGLKIVSSVLQHDINHDMSRDEDFWGNFRVFVNEPRHLLRSISPSVNDIIFAQRLGMLAVDNAMAGYTDFMVSQWLTEYVLVPLELVVLGKKRVPQDGIFWKSVRDNLK